LHFHSWQIVRTFGHKNLNKASRMRKMHKIPYNIFRTTRPNATKQKRTTTTIITTIIPKVTTAITTTKNHSIIDNS